MIQKYKTGGLTWIDLNNPTGEEIREVTADYRIHPLVARELTIPTLRPKVDIYENFIYLILHFPSVDRSKDGAEDQEVDFIVGRNFIITARYGEVDALLAFSKSFEVESILEKGSVGDHAGFIFYAMMSRIYEALLHRIEGVKDEATIIESEIFKGREREMVRKISELSRYLLDYKRATTLHHEILESFEVAALKFFGPDFKFHLRKLLGDYFKVEHSIKNTMEFVFELRETNNALLTTKQNEITQRLTIIAFIALPLTIMTSLLQIETIGRPIVGHYSYDFWLVLGVELIVSVFLFMFFKMKKWL